MTDKSDWLRIRNDYSVRSENWTFSQVAILGADQKERGLWGREWTQIEYSAHAQMTGPVTNPADDQEDCGLWRRE